MMLRKWYRVRISYYANEGYTANVRTNNNNARHQEYEYKRYNKQQRQQRISNVIQVPNVPIYTTRRATPPEEPHRTHTLQTTDSTFALRFSGGNSLTVVSDGAVRTLLLPRWRCESMSGRSFISCDSTSTKTCWTGCSEIG